MDESSQSLLNGKVAELLRKPSPLKLQLEQQINFLKKHRTPGKAVAVSSQKATSSSPAQSDGGAGDTVLTCDVRLPPAEPTPASRHVRPTPGVTRPAAASHSLTAAAPVHRHQPSPAAQANTTTSTTAQLVDYSDGEESDAVAPFIDYKSRVAASSSRDGGTTSASRWHSISGWHSPATSTGGMVARGMTGSGTRELTEQLISEGYNLQMPPGGTDMPCDLDDEDLDLTPPLYRYRLRTGSGGGRVACLCCPRRGGAAPGETGATGKLGYYRIGSGGAAAACNSCTIL